MKAPATRTLATRFKEVLKGTENCTIEIRTPLGNTAGQRLQKSLSIAGVDAELIDVAATPHTGVLIEASQQCAEVALSLQTAFKAGGQEAHLLVQNTRRPDLVIIHLNSDPPKTAPK